MPDHPAYHWFKRQGFFNSPLHPFIAAGLLLQAAGLMFVMTNPETALHTLTPLNSLGFALLFTTLTLLTKRLKLDSSLTSLIMSSAAGLWLGTLLSLLHG